MYDVLIVGGGPGGLTAADYCAGGGLKTAVIERLPACGGQMCLTDTVDNFPGLPAMSGFDIGQRLKSRAEERGAEFIRGKVTEIEDGDVKRVTAGGRVYEGKALIYAGGAVHRKLNALGEERLAAKGVSYCAVCDGGFYKGKRAAVIGGGDTALRDALYLSGICERVFLIHRREEFRGQDILVKRCREKENIDIYRGAVCGEILGEKRVCGIDLRSAVPGGAISVSAGDVVSENGGNDEREETGRDSLHIDCEGVFIAVGMTPETELLRGICELDGEGYVIAGEDCVTSAAGVFAAGDVRSKKFRQIITAAADGANAAHSAEIYLTEKWS